MDREKLCELIKLHEGCETKVYFDTEWIKTIGVGFNLERAGARELIEACGADYGLVCAGDVELDEEQVDRLLDGDLDTATEDAKENFSTFEEMDEVRQMVVVDMSFNLGRARLAGFRNMRAAVEEGDWERAAREMLDSRWARQVKTRAERLAEMMRTGEMAV